MNKAVFGGLKRDDSDTLKIGDMFCTDVRIRKKILYLINQEGMPLDRKLMHKLPIMVVEDIIKEEYSTIVLKFKNLNIPTLKQIAAKKCLDEIDKMMVEKIREKGPG